MKRLCILIVIAFIVLYSNNIGAQEIQQPLDAIKELVSENNGTIRDSYFAGANSGILIHIQDLHCNYDAQMSIYGIIDELIDKYNLKLVTIEGNMGKLVTDAFRRTDDMKIREQVAKYFVKLGDLDGAALAHIMRDGKFTFWGADDKDLYWKNVDAYKVSLKNKNTNASYYNNMNNILKQLKEKAYSKELKELDEKMHSQKNDDAGFSEYVAYLNGLMNQYAIGKENYPNFTRLVEVLNKESDIEFLEVDSQRAEYIDLLSETLDKNNLSELLDKSLYFKTGKLSALAFYSYLEHVSQKENTPSLEDEYSQLAKYIDYIKLYSQIDNIKLFKEIDGLEKAAKEKLYRNDTERKIDRLSYTLEIMNDLFNLKLTKETLQYYRDNRNEFTTAAFINFISDTAPKYKVNYKLDPVFRRIDAELPDLEKFYKLAEERDGVLVYNTLNKMRQQRADLAVLVSGGFHTDGITQLLKDKKISYVVITPKVESLQADNPYKSVLLGEKNEFDRFYELAVKNAK